MGNNLLSSALKVSGGGRGGWGEVPEETGAVWVMGLLIWCLAFKEL